MPRQADPKARLIKQREKIEAQLRELEESERYKEIDALIGRTLRQHAASDPAFHEQMMAILHRTLRGKRERRLVGVDDGSQAAARSNTNESEARMPLT